MKTNFKIIFICFFTSSMLVSCFGGSYTSDEIDKAMKNLEKDGIFDNSETTTDVTPKKEIPKMTEDECLIYFQKEWDKVELVKKDGISQYETYSDELNSILNDMVTVLEKDPANNDLSKSTTKLNKLRLKFINSKKNKDATVNWLTYGQPHSEYDLQLACESVLKENANDPESINIENCKIPN